MTFQPNTIAGLQMNFQHSNHRVSSEDAPDSCRYTEAWNAFYVKASMMKRHLAAKPDEVEKLPRVWNCPHG